MTRGFRHTKLSKKINTTMVCRQLWKSKHITTIRQRFFFFPYLGKTKEKSDRVKYVAKFVYSGDLKLSSRF